MLEETGANNLYLALGSLVWELDGRPLRPAGAHPRRPHADGPHRLLPAGAGRGRVEHAELLPAGEAAPGARLAVPTLTEAVDGTLDLDAALEAMRTALVGHGLPYRVESTADLAILQFAKFRLWKDLDENWADFAENPLVGHLVHEPTEAFEDPARDTGGFADLDDLAAQLPAPADASQLRAIAEADAGRTFVLEGPPGTGKSQTITNLLTHAVAAGKRVLFVAEKRAALDVVARRLDAVGMGMFALDLHDKGSRASMCARRSGWRSSTRSPSTSRASQDGETLRSARRMLARYADRLHHDNAAGLSLYSARTAELTAGTEVEALPVPEPFVANAPEEVLRSVRVALALLPDIADLTRPSLRHLWAFVDSRDRPAGHPDRGRRRRRRGARGVARSRSCPGCCAGRSPPTSSTRWRTSSAARRSVSTSSTRRSPSLDGGDERRPARSRRSPRSVTRASTSARPRCCASRWPTSTWRPRPPRRRPGSAGAAG